MKVVILAIYDANVFPGLFHLGVELSKAGAEVYFVAAVEPKVTGVSSHNVVWVPIPEAVGLKRKIPWFRSSYQNIFNILDGIQPNWIIAQHQYMNPALLHKLLKPWRREKVAAYFTDYHEGWRYLDIAKRLIQKLDAYVDICDVRLDWRTKDWPQMDAAQFVIRQAPFKNHSKFICHKAEKPKIVLTASRHMLSMDHSRLSLFINRICEHGISLDWYLAGSKQDRDLATALSNNPLYQVRNPVPKSTLLGVLQKYDAGLFWGPMVERNPRNPLDKSYFLSAASNKIGEYISSGLIVAHTGNPGLSYLPEEVCVVFDPTDPLAGADQLAVALTDRQAREIKRQSAINYHLEEMHFEAQAAPFVEHLMKKDIIDP